MDDSRYWNELYELLIEKLNKFLHDQDTSEELAYFFEPVSDDEHEKIFSFTNPFKKISVKFKKVIDNLTDHRFQLVDRNIKEEDLLEMLNALDHVEKRSRDRNIQNVNQPHWDPSRKNEFPYEDFYETEDELIINIEVPPLDEEEIEIRATPQNLEIIAGNNYHRQIKFDTPVNPDSAIAQYDGKGLIEVKFEKMSKNKDYTSIEIQKS